MESKVYKFASIHSTILLLCLYFGGYLFLFPKLATILTLWLNPLATHIAYPLIIAVYVITIMGVFIIGSYFLKGQWMNFTTYKKENILRIFYSFCFIIFMNFLLSILVSLLTNSQGSNNQASIAESSQIAPLLTGFAAIFIAPLLEEIVFRGGVFTTLRARFPLCISLVVSSVLFGSIHIIDSLINGNLLDVSYLLVYSVIGCVLAYSYEKSGSLIVPVCIHMLNNILAYFLLMM